MRYDKNSFLAGLSTGLNLKGTAGSNGGGGGGDSGIIGEPIAVTIADWDEDRLGHTYTLTLSNYKISDTGVQLGLMPNSPVYNTQAVVAAGLTIVNSYSGTDSCTITISAINVPSGAITIALFGLIYGEVVAANINNYSWEEISQISAAGEANKYFKRGDAKEIFLSGRVGEGLTLNQKLYVFILDIGHDNDGRITFMGFRDNLGELNYDTVHNIALVDSAYGTDLFSYPENEGKKLFNWNHYLDQETYEGSVAGGWKGCDLRYDILGSTNLPPSQYGKPKSLWNVGYDAPDDTCLSPVPDTLMAALPEDLRKVMQPMRIYSNNLGANANLGISASIDYLPLLSYYEISGWPPARRLERKKQVHYPRLSQGLNAFGSSFRSILDVSKYPTCWTRSCEGEVDSEYPWGVNNGSGTVADFCTSYGITPIFKV